MSWLFSQALVEEYLGENFSDGEQSAQLNGKPIQQAYCAPDKMTDFSRLSRFGMTYKPLTESRGEELLTSYLAGFHAKTFQPQEMEMDSKEKEAECGIKWRGWLAKYNQNSCSWKTPQCSLLEEEQESLETLPKWGMTVDGLLWEQPMWMPHTKEREFGFLPTPVASDCKGGTSKTVHYINQRYVRISLTTGTEFGAKLSAAYQLMTGSPLPANFSEWMMGWPQGWTDLKPLEMDKSHFVQQQLGES